MDTPEQFKDQTRTAWDQAASGWDQHTPQIHHWLLETTQAMLDAAGIRPGDHVLDVAAGAGDQTLDLARRVGPQGHVLATDLSPEILQRAQQRAQEAGQQQVEFRVADAEDLQLSPGTFDAAICRLGLMFCPQPLLALQGIWQALKPGGKAVVVVFSEPAANPCVGILMSTALQHAGKTPQALPQTGGLFSLSKPGLLEGLFATAGFQEVQALKLQAPFQLNTAREYMTFIQASASPIGQLLSGLSEAARAAAWSEMESKLQVFQTAEGWVGPNELLLVSGTR